MMSKMSPLLMKIGVLWCIAGVCTVLIVKYKESQEFESKHDAIRKSVIGHRNSACSHITSVMMVTQMLHFVSQNLGLNQTSQMWKQYMAANPQVQSIRVINASTAYSFDGTKWIGSSFNFVMLPSHRNRVHILNQTDFMSDIVLDVDHWTEFVDQGLLSIVTRVRINAPEFAMSTRDSTIMAAHPHWICEAIGSCCENKDLCPSIPITICSDAAEKIQAYI